MLVILKVYLIFHFTHFSGMFMSESINYCCPHPVFVKLYWNTKKALSFTYLSMVAFPLQEQGCVVVVETYTQQNQKYLRYSH